MRGSWASKLIAEARGVAEALWDALPERRDVRLADVARAQRTVDVRRDDFFTRRWGRFPLGRARELALARRGGQARMAHLASDLKLEHQQGRPEGRPCSG